MIIKWEGKGLLMVPVLHKKDEQKVDENGNPVEIPAEIRNRPPIVGGERLIRIVPGYSEINDEDWQLIKPHLADKIKSKQVDYLAKEIKDGDSVIEKPEVFNKMHPTTARKVALGCFDIPTLNMWRSGDDRSEIRTVIENQIEAIHKGMPIESEK